MPYFVKCFLCIYWEDHLVLVFSLADMINHIIKTKPICSQTQLQALVADAGMLSRVSGQRAGLGAAPGAAHCRTNAACCFSFLPFFFSIEAQILLGFVSIVKTSANVGLS